MSRARKNGPGKAVSDRSGAQGSGAVSPSAHGVARAQGKTPQRKRGWRDIEAMRERARLKRMLSDIWHEDIELEDDIFGETDHLAGYYTDSGEEDEPVEPDEDPEYEEFDEDED